MNYRQDDVKQINRKNVLSLIAEKGSISRRDICTLLGSSMTTVLKITDYLEERGWVSVSGKASTSRGRSPHILTFCPDRITSLAVDYNGKRADVALCNYYGKELFFQSYVTSNDIVIFFQDYLPRIIKEFIKKSRCLQENIVGIGVCLPGDFSPNGQYYELGPLSQFQNAVHFSAAFKHFQELVSIPAYCYNDVNAFAYGEFRTREDRQSNDMAFLYAGDGFGAGLIIDSKLRLGEHFMAGEVGYVTYDPQYITDIKRPGWLESRLSRSCLEAEFPELKDGVVSDELVDYVARMISMTIANISNILDIKDFVLDGDIVRKLESNGLQSRIGYYTSRQCLIPVNIDRPRCKHPNLTGLSLLVFSDGIYDFLKKEK